MNHYFTNNDNIKSELRLLNYNFNDIKFSFYSDNGVFSKNKIDFGTKLLIDTFLRNVKEKNKNILDVGCGYGIIGIVVSKVNDSFSDLVDVNRRCIHLAKRNIELNKVECNTFISNVYENVDKLYDYVITNPPIRTGKENVKKILLNAPLKENGQLWCVIRKEQGAKSYINILKEKYNVSVVEKEKGFYIIMAKKTIDI